MKKVGHKFTLNHIVSYMIGTVNILQTKQPVLKCLLYGNNIIYIYRYIVEIH